MNEYIKWQSATEKTHTVQPFVQKTNGRKHTYIS